MEVRLEHITKAYGAQKNEKALDDLNIRIRSGKLTGFLGPSGCGKSTLLSLIAGIEEPTEGKIFFDGQDVTKLPPEKRSIGMVFQNYALYPHLTVRDNIAFPLLNSALLKKQIKDELIRQGTGESFQRAVAKRVEETAALLDIKELLERKPAKLSGGQQQRAAIARAIVKRPSLLLFDEPLSNLDARLRLQIREEIRHLQTETGITTIFVTHDQEEALEICDELAVIKKGVVQQYDSPFKIYDFPSNRFVAEFIGTPPVNFLNGNLEGEYLWGSGQSWWELSGKPEYKEVHIGVRAEKLLLLKVQGEHTLPAVVQNVRKSGGAPLLEVSLPDNSILKLFKSPHWEPEVGDTVWVYAKREDLLLFDKNGRRLETW